MKKIQNYHLQDGFVHIETEDGVDVIRLSEVSSYNYRTYKQSSRRYPYDTIGHAYEFGIITKAQVSFIFEFKDEDKYIRFVKVFKEWFHK